jgi:serine/threonine protein kinase
MNDPSRPELDDPRVIAALDEYLAALEAGQRPNRQAFLARHAAVADALAECLDGMEALHEASSSTQLPAAGLPAGEWQPGTPLGDFRIVREIGRGGMGVVYEAEQLSLGRRIALKVLPFALTLDSRQLQRFKNEARAAAQLHHPHIVPVHAVGCERGVHFYAMQFIDGQSLAEVIGGLRRLGRPGAGPVAPEPSALRPSIAATKGAADTGRSLATAYSTDSRQFYRGVARLGIQAAEALEHAHEYGVVHRDVKPANLLLDGEGRLWVTDFGLAQLQTDPGLTHTGDLLGTLRYMSPEQAGGQRTLVDHRTDVYSLGATLYELLTLRPPFDGADRHTLLRQILEDEPRPPRALVPSIPVELETIVLRAIGKAPAGRYATARELADDLQRFLEDRPIRARRPSFVEKATKWARRHRAVVAAAVVALLLSVAGLSVATVLAARAYEREREKAREAEESFRQARRAVDQFAQISEEELAGNPFTEGTRRRMLEAALEYYQNFIDQRRDDPSTQEELKASRDRAERIIAELTTLMGAGKYGLLRHKEVQDELHADAEQRDALAKLDPRRHPGSHEMFRPGPEGERRRLAWAREQEAEVARVLRPEQLRRFKQIALQAQGVGAFREPEVAAALKLTAEQRERLRAIESDVFFAHPDRPRPGLSLPDPAGKTAAEVREAAMARARAVLTEEQLRRWKELIGEQYRGPLPGPLGRPPGPPPGPPPGHPGGFR